MPSKSGKEVRVKFSSELNAVIIVLGVVAALVGIQSLTGGISTSGKAIEKPYSQAECMADLPTDAGLTQERKLEMCPPEGPGAQGPTGSEGPDGPPEDCQGKPLTSADTCCKYEGDEKIYKETSNGKCCGLQVMGSDQQCCNEILPCSKDTICRQVDDLLDGSKVDVCGECPDKEVNPSSDDCATKYGDVGGWSCIAYRCSPNSAGGRNEHEIAMDAGRSLGLQHKARGWSVGNILQQARQLSGVERAAYCDAALGLNNQYTQTCFQQ